MISSTQNEEMSSGNDEMEAEVNAEAIQEAAEANMIFSMHCENFAILVKITVHRKNLNFAMPCFFRYDSEISLS